MRHGVYCIICMKMKYRHFYYTLDRTSLMLRWEHSSHGRNMFEQCCDYVNANIINNNNNKLS